MKAKEEEIKEMEEDLREVSEIEVFRQSKGGKILVQSLLKDIISSVDNLCVNHNKLTHQEFVAISAGIKANKDLLDVLVKAKGNKEFLENLLKEALEKAE